MKFKPNLDLLRSVAISLVVLDHILLAHGVDRFTLWHLSWLSSWIGVLGVYFFFVHTCLVLMWSLERKPHTLDFYIRRAFRIYPLAIFAILLVVGLRLPISSDTVQLFIPYHATALGVLSNVLLIQNISHRGGYVLGVLWSLPLEVDMYVLLPALYFFVRKNFSLWPLLVLWGLACGLSHHDVMLGNIFATVIPCFLPGSMAYVLYSRVRATLPAWSFLVFLVLLCIGFTRFNSVDAGWIACLVLGLALARFRQISFAPLVRLVHEMAKYSYSTYLGHWFALGISFHLLSLSSFPQQVGLTLALTALFSVLGYHLIESPMIRLGASVAAKAELRYEQHSHQE
jgi:peptidoglycan/LPS O-acetylase OafA/YrhL